MHNQVTVYGFRASKNEKTKLFYKKNIEIFMGK